MCVYVSQHHVEDHVGHSGVRQSPLNHSSTACILLFVRPSSLCTVCHKISKRLQFQMPEETPKSQGFVVSPSLSGVILHEIGGMIQPSKRFLASNLPVLDHEKISRSNLQITLQLRRH